MRLAGSLSGLLALAGCQFSSVTPVAMRGPAPALIAIWPTVPAPFAASEAALLTGLGDAVSDRGFRIVAPAVARQLLVDAGRWRPHVAPAELAATGLALGADAVLVLEVRAFESSSGARSGHLEVARWDLGWRLLSTVGRGVLWEYSHQGAWRASDGDDFDSLRRLDAPPATVPIGGGRGWSFRKADELAANLHRLALQHLPRR